MMDTFKCTTVLIIEFLFDLSIKQQSCTEYNEYYFYTVLIQSTVNRRLLSSDIICL